MGRLLLSILSLAVAVVLVSFFLRAWGDRKV